MVVPEQNEQLWGFPQEEGTQLEVRPWLLHASALSEDLSEMEMLSLESR